MKNIYILTLFAFLTLTTNAQNTLFKEGDLLFQDLDCGPFCDAIESVTSGFNDYDFSHIGVVVEDEQGRLGILEAISKGVVITPIDSFLSRSINVKGDPKIVVGRIKPDFQKAIEPALHYLDGKLGKSYDDLFDLNNDKYYCSELIYLAFRHPKNKRPIFKTSPMTFKEPGKDAFYEIWIDYYASFKAEIPEGAPGINPAGISKSVYLDLKYPYGTPTEWK